MVINDKELEKILTKGRFITWLKDHEDLSTHYNENSLTKNSLCYFLKYTEEFKYVENLMVEYTELQCSYLDDVIELSLPLWVVEFSNQMFDYYYSEKTSETFVTVKQMLMYFGEA